MALSLTRPLGESTEGDPLVERVDALSRLAWGVRSHLLLIACIFALSLAVSVARSAPWLSGGPAAFSSSALVVATKLGVRTDQLPRLVEAIFRAGPVADRLAQEVGTPTSGTLIPDRVHLEPVQDTLGIEVVGTDVDAQRAALWANHAAAALVDELNKVGPGLGQFVVLEQARPPVRTPQTGRWVYSLIAIVAAAFLSLGVVGAIVIRRRPVLTPHEVSVLSGLPVLQKLKLPSLRKAAEMNVSVVGGLSALMKKLSPDLLGVCALVACDGSEKSAAVLTYVACRFAARYMPVVLGVSSDGPLVTDLMIKVDGEENIEFRQLHRGSATLGEGNDLAFIAGLETARADVPQSLPKGARVVLVVSKGTRSAAVHEAQRQFLPGEVLGVVFVGRQVLVS